MGNSEQEGPKIKMSCRSRKKTRVAGAWGGLAGSGVREGDGGEIGRAMAATVEGWGILSAVGSHWRVLGRGVAGSGLLGGGQE